MKISLIIATYNRAEALVEALKSVVEQSLPTSEWECVVVNNRSTDSTREQFEAFAAQHPEKPLRLIYEGQQGLSHARNAGIRAARGELIAIIDDDERINRDFLRAYVELFRDHPEAGAAGGTVVARYEEQPRPKWMSRWIEEPIANPMEYGTRVCPFPRGRIPAGGNMAFRRTIFERYGLFNPALGRIGDRLIGGEESDLFARLRQGGEAILYTPHAVMEHLIPARKLTRQYVEQLSFNIGVSQRARAEMGGYTGRLWMGEVAKWCATLLLAAGYLLTLRPQKGEYLLRMRYRITRGILHLKR